MRTKKTGFLFLAHGSVALLALMLCSACPSGQSGSAERNRPQSNAPVPVAIATAVEKTVPLQVQAIGTVEPYSTVAVRAQIEGQLERAHFKEGQDVGAGDLLFTIDSRPYKAALEQAQANLARDKILAENARKDAERDQALFKKGILSEEERDRTLANAAAFDAAVRADIAAVETAKVGLSYCTIYSPLDGRTGTLKVHQGNLVKGNDTLVVIVRTRPIYVAFHVPEQDLPQIRSYMVRGKLKVETHTSKEMVNPAVGELTFIENTVDETLGTILLKGTFPNTDRTLWPGQFVNVVLTLAEQPNRIVVPGQAVQTGQQGRYVFVVRDDLTVTSRPVVVDRTTDNEAVIAKGLAAGEKVVTDGHLRLVEGALVRSAQLGATEATSQPAAQSRPSAKAK